MDQEALSKLFMRHHLLVIPVVDHRGASKASSPSTISSTSSRKKPPKTFRKSAAPSRWKDRTYRSLAKMIRKRAGWLAALFLGEMLTATAMGQFEAEIAHAVVLALFVPLIISSGGNSGSQATTLVIRAMALGEVRLLDWWRVIRREFATGLALGSILASYRSRAYSTLAIILQCLRRSLFSDRAHRRAESGRRGVVGVLDGLDAAVHPARLGLRPGERLRAVCRHPGGRNRSGDLFHRRGSDSARHACCDGGVLRALPARASTGYVRAACRACAGSSPALVRESAATARRNLPSTM